jgi:hypothetical protein
MDNLAARTSEPFFQAISASPQFPGNYAQLCIPKHEPRVIPAVRWCTSSAIASLRAAARLMAARSGMTICASRCVTCARNWATSYDKVKSSFNSLDEAADRAIWTNVRTDLRDCEFRNVASLSSTPWSHSASTKSRTPNPHGKRVGDGIAGLHRRQSVQKTATNAGMTDRRGKDRNVRRSNPIRGVSNIFAKLSCDGHSPASVHVALQEA